MNFRNNMYPQRNMHNVPQSMAQSPMQRNLGGGHMGSPMRMNQSFGGRTPQNMQFAGANNYGGPARGGQFGFAGNRRPDQYNYDQAMPRNRYGRQGAGNFRGSNYDSFPSLQDSRKNFNYDSDAYDPSEEEFYDYGKPISRRENSRRASGGNFFSRLGGNTRNRYDDEEDYRDRRSSKSLNKRDRASQYDDDYEDDRYGNEENYRDRRSSKSLNKRDRASQYDDDYEDDRYDDEEDYRDRRSSKSLNKRDRASQYDDDYEDDRYDDEEDYRDRRSSKSLNKRDRVKYDDEYEDDKLSDRKSRISWSGPINFFKKKKRG